MENAAHPHAAFAPCTALLYHHRLRTQLLRLSHHRQCTTASALAGVSRCRKSLGIYTCIMDPTHTVLKVVKSGKVCTRHEGPSIHPTSGGAHPQKSFKHMS